MKKKSTNLSSSPSMVSSSRSSPNYEEAATKVGSTLPIDLIMNILSRLPAKSLSKFKCVSKQWFGLITDPYLISTHRALALQNPNLLLLKKAQSIEESKDTQMQISTRISVCSIDFEGNQNFEFVLDLDDDNIDMLPSKWDLICFAGANNGFYVCNPSTQELVKLPEANCCTNGDINAGMGYIKEMNEYVLIHLFDRSLDLQVDYEIGCEIIRWSDGCSIKDRNWKVVEANCSYVVRGWGVLVENVFYWMIWDEYALSGDDAILSFDLEKEEFVTVLPPEWCFDPHGVWFLVELKERLCLVDNSTKPFTMDIWVLKDSKNHSWVKEYCIDLNGFVENSLKFIVPLDHRGGKILIDANLESLEQYDVEKKCFKKMNKLNTRESTWLRLYTDSFFSLGSQ